MRKRTVRNGMRLVLAAMILIILASFYHGAIADLLDLTMASEQRFYSLGIFWAAAMGGYGAVLAVLGFVLPATSRDAGIRIMPLILMVMGVVALFFYLFAASFSAPAEQRRLQPDRSITI